jgi:drug/metabolite transporter (DMT)-like permease
MSETGAQRDGTGGSRKALWLLLLPAVLYCAAPVVADRIEPRVFGVPFLLAWVVMATVLSPLIIWAAARRDPLYRSGASEPIPADRQDGEDGQDKPGASDTEGTA